MSSFHPETNIGTIRRNKAMFANRAHDWPDERLLLHAGEHVEVHPERETEGAVTR